jgi:hypothetical protein
MHGETVKYFRQLWTGLLASKYKLAVDCLNAGEETRSRYDQGIMKTALLPSVALSVVWCNEATKCHVSAGQMAVNKRIPHISPCLAEFSKPTFHAIYTKSLMAKSRVHVSVICSPQHFVFFLARSHSRENRILAPSRSSACPQVSPRLPLKGFSRNWILGDFIKICQENPNLGKIGQKCRHFKT